MGVTGRARFRVIGGVAFVEEDGDADDDDDDDDEEPPVCLVCLVCFTGVGDDNEEEEEEEVEFVAGDDLSFSLIRSRSEGVVLLSSPSCFARSCPLVLSGAPPPRPARTDGVEVDRRGGGVSFSFTVSATVVGPCCCPLAFRFSLTMSFTEPLEPSFCTAPDPEACLFVVVVVVVVGAAARAPRPAVGDCSVVLLVDSSEGDAWMGVPAFDVLLVVRIVVSGDACASGVVAVAARRAAARRVSVVLVKRVEGEEEAAVDEEEDDEDTPDADDRVARVVVVGLGVVPSVLDSGVFVPRFRSRLGRWGVFNGSSSCSSASSASISSEIGVTGSTCCRVDRGVTGVPREDERRSDRRGSTFSLAASGKSSSTLVAICERVERPRGVVGDGTGLDEEEPALLRGDDRIEGSSIARPKPREERRDIFLVFRFWSFGAVFLFFFSVKIVTRNAKVFFFSVDLTSSPICTFANKREKVMITSRNNTHKRSMITTTRTRPRTTTKKAFSLLELGRELRRVKLGQVGGLNLNLDTDELLLELGLGGRQEHLLLDGTSVGGPGDEEDARGAATSLNLAVIVEDGVAALLGVQAADELLPGALAVLALDNDLSVGIVEDEGSITELGLAVLDIVEGLDDLIADLNSAGHFELD